MSLQGWALVGLSAIYKSGFYYKKAGVILSAICDASIYQGDLFAAEVKHPALMQTLDAINTRYGKGTLKLSQDGSRSAWKMRQEKKSPEYTTNWAELPICG